MKKELDKSKGSYKLDLIETANVDPMIKPADFKLLAAYVAVMAWPSCKTWLVEPLGRAMTGLSHGQFWNSRARLLGDNEEKRAYLIAVRQSGKVATYKLINPWRDEARTMVEAKLGNYREVARQKKEGKRAASSFQNLEGSKADPSLQKMEGQNGAVPPESGVMSLQNLGPITPQDYPNEKAGREEGPSGSNVVSIDIKRRNAS